ncbi:hypothetical protein NKG94_11060 [Micromonospora sp. M12]
MLFDPPAVDEATTLGSVGAALLGSFAAPFAPSTGELGAGRSCSTQRRPAHPVAYRRFCHCGAGRRGHLGRPGVGQLERRLRRGHGRAGRPGVVARVAAAEAVRRAARAARGEVRGLEIGEVRAAATNASGAVEPPAQTETVWEGLARPDGRPNGARRLPVRREQPAPLPG